MLKAKLYPQALELGKSGQKNAMNPNGQENNPMFVFEAANILGCEADPVGERAEYQVVHVQLNWYSLSTVIGL